MSSVSAKERSVVEAAFLPATHNGASSASVWAIFETKVIDVAVIEATTLLMLENYLRQSHQLQFE